MNKKFGCPFFPYNFKKLPLRKNVLIFQLRYVKILLVGGGYMKYTTHIDPKRDEEIVIYAHEYNDTVKKIEQLASEVSNELIGFENKNTFI